MHSKALHIVCITHCRLKRHVRIQKRSLKESEEGATADLEFDEECGPPPPMEIAPDLEINEMSTPTAKDTQEMQNIKQVHQEQISMLIKKKLKASQQKTGRLKKGMQL